MALKRRRRPTPPGLVLKDSVLGPHKISITDLAEVVGLSRTHMSQIINGHQRLEPWVAARVAKSLGLHVAPLIRMQAAVDAWDAGIEASDWEPERVLVRSA